MSKPNKFDFLTEARETPTETEAAAPEVIESAQNSESTSAQSIESTKAQSRKSTSTQDSNRANAQSRKSTNAQARKSTSAQTGDDRRPSGQRIRADLLRDIKILSAQTGVKQYLLIEEALEQYLAKKRTR